MITLPHLDTNITLACQNSCVACNHLVVPYRSATGGPPSTTPDQVASDLGSLAKILHVNAWGALGGEPTLHRDLVQILLAAEESGIADIIELWSHGQTLHRAENQHGAAFWTSFDRLIVSAYPGKHTPESLAWIEAQCREYQIEYILKDESQHPNFTALLDAAPSGPAYTREKYQACWFRTMARTADFGYFFTCCTAPHIPHLLQGQSFGTDGIAIKDITEEGLLAYLNQPTPLGACTVCAGRMTRTAVNIPWAEYRDKREWLAKSAGLETAR